MTKNSAREVVINICAVLKRKWKNPLKNQNKNQERLKSSQGKEKQS